MRNIPSALLAHLQSDVTTTCRLLKITLADGRVFGMTSLDKDVDYNGVTYKASSGTDPSVIATDTGLDVDNGESFTLFSASEEDGGLTVAMVEAGELDDAQWIMYLINYNDTSMGHVIIDAGDTGYVTVKNREAGEVELLSYTARLKQKVGTFDSRTCRARFGQQELDQWHCGFNAESAWLTGTITAREIEEPNRIFTCDLTLDLKMAPGRVEFLTGKNATQNRMYQVENVETTASAIFLVETTPYPVEVGDTFRIRRDCDKLWTTCKNDFDNLVNFKGEPYIPSGDGLS